MICYNFALFKNSTHLLWWIVISFTIHTRSLCMICVIFIIPPQVRCAVIVWDQIYLILKLTHYLQSLMAYNLSYWPITYSSYLHTNRLILFNWELKVLQHLILLVLLHCTILFLISSSIIGFSTGSGWFCISLHTELAVIVVRVIQLVAILVIIIN